MAGEIMRGRKEIRKARKESIQNGSWEEIISILAGDNIADVMTCRKQLEKAGLSLDALRNIALHSRARLVYISKNGAIEISLRKADHTAVVVISEDGSMNTLMKDYIDY